MKVYYKPYITKTGAPDKKTIYLVWDYVPVCRTFFNEKDAYEYFKEITLKRPGAKSNEG